MPLQKPLPKHISKHDINTLYNLSSNGDVPQAEAWIKKFGTEHLDHQSFHSWTALMYAAREGRTDLVSLLLRHGADPLIKNDLGHDALYYARKMNYADTAAVLNAEVERHLKEQDRRADLAKKAVVEEQIQVLKRQTRKFKL